MNAHKPLRFLSLLMLELFVQTVAMAGERADVGVVVTHGKWGLPDGLPAGHANYL